MNFEKKIILMAFIDPPSTLDLLFFLLFLMEVLKEEREKPSIDFENISTWLFDLGLNMSYISFKVKIILLKSK